jgi:hypothetical protein
MDIDQDKVDQAVLALLSSATTVSADVMVETSASMMCFNRTALFS